MSEDTVRTCKGLADVERRFRTLKGRDIRVRPIRHRDERWVRAHPFLCLLAGYLERHLRRARAPLPFDDGPPAEARRTRDPVAPAQPTECARHGKTRRHSDDGTLLHSFDTLIAELATRCCNTRRIPDGPAAPLNAAQHTSSKRSQYREFRKAENPAFNQSVDPCHTRGTSV